MVFCGIVSLENGRPAGVEMIVNYAYVQWRYTETCATQKHEYKNMNTEF